MFCKGEQVSLFFFFFSGNSVLHLLEIIFCTGEQVRQAACDGEVDGGSGWQDGEQGDSPHQLNVIVIVLY